MPLPEQIWRYRDEVHRLARQLCRHREDAEDVAQASLLKAATHLKDFRGEASLRTWLYRIVTNECRMLRRRQPHFSLEQLLEAAATEEAPPLDLPDEMPDPEEIVMEAELRQKVLEVLEQLPERYRTVLLLKEGEGLKDSEIAQAMGMTVPAVKALIHRARTAFRTAIQRTLGITPAR